MRLRSGTGSEAAGSSDLPAKSLPVGSPDANNCTNGKSSAGKSPAGKLGLNGEGLQLESQSSLEGSDGGKMSLIQKAKAAAQKRRTQRTTAVVS